MKKKQTKKTKTRCWFMPESAFENDEGVRVLYRGNSACIPGKEFGESRVHIQDVAKSAFMYLEHSERMGFKGIVVYLDCEIMGYAECRTNSSSERKHRLRSKALDSNTMTSASRSRRINE